MKTFGEQDHNQIFETNAIKKINYGGINSFVYTFFTYIYIDTHTHTHLYTHIYTKCMYTL